MPRKATRASRQSSGQRRSTYKPQHQTVTAPVDIPGAAPDSPEPSRLSAASPTATSPRPVRRPAATPASGGQLSPEQVRSEARYIRRDLIRMLITTLIVVVFMVAANLILN